MRWLIGITALAAVIRFATLDLQSFHHDEAVTANEVIQPGLGDTLSAVAEGERSPPLYYLLVWLWSQLFGTGEAGLRSLSALIGTLTVPAAFLAARELARPVRAEGARSNERGFRDREPRTTTTRIGLWAAAFVALNPLLVWYSQEARSYALMVLFAALSVACFARARRDPSSRNLALWAATGGLALLSHYFAIFVIAAEAALLLWLASAGRRRVVVALCAVGLLAASLVPLARSQEGESRRNAFADTSLAARAGEVGLNYVASDEPDPLAGSRRVDAIQIGAAAAGGSLFLLAIGLVAARGSPAERRGALLAGGIAAGVIAGPLALALIGLDFLNPRNLVAGAVPMLCIGAIGIGALRGGRLALAAGIATCAMFAGVVAAVNLLEEMQRENWRHAAERMGASAAPRLIVTNHNGDDPLAYYLDAEEFEGREYAAGTKVDEVLTLSTSYRTSEPPGFYLTHEEGLAPLFVLRRFESSRPRLIRPKEVAGRKVLSERSSVLLDLPG